MKILAKPHKQVTKWFDSISQYTVKNNYKNASKNLDALENFIKLQKDKLPREKQSLLEAKLKEMFGDEYDEAKATEMIDGILNDNKELVDAGDWGALVGVLNKGVVK